MRLRELTLTQVRGVTHRTVTFVDGEGDGNGVVIIQGENEAGKTTLRDAFVALLTYKASSRHADVKALQTVGRDEGPDVAATFDLAGRRFTYRKQFIKRPTTELTVTGDDARQLTGDEAHDYVVKALDDALDRGLWQALWLTQRELVDQPELDGTFGLTDVLQRDSNVTAAAGMVEHAVMEQARQRYLSFFTEKAGQLRAEFKQRDDAHQAAVEKLAELTAQRQLIDEDSAERDRLNQAIPRILTQLDDAIRYHATVTEQQTALASLRQTRALTAAERDTAIAQRDRIKHAHDRRAELKSEHDRRTREVAVLADEHASYDASVATLAHELAAAAATRNDAHDARDRARAAYRDATARRDEIAALVTRDTVIARYDRMVALDHEIAAHDDARKRLPTTADFAAIDDAKRAYDVALIRQEQAAPELTITTHTDVDVRIDDDPATFTQGVAHTRPVIRPTRIRIADLATVAIDVTTGDTARALADATDALRDLLAAHGLDSYDDTLSARDELAHVTACQQRLRDDLAELLHGDERDTIEQAYRTARQNDGDTPTETLDQADSRLRDVARQRDACDEAYDAAEQAERALRRIHDEAVTHATTTKVTLVNAEQELARLQHDLDTADDLTDALAHAEQTVATLTDRCAELDRELQHAGADDIDVVVANADAVVHDLKTSHADTVKRRDQLDTSIRVRGGDGLFDRCEDAASRVAMLADERDAVLHRADVAKRLYDTLDTHRAAAHSRFVQPLYDEILGFGRLLYGASFDVAFDDTLAIARRHVDGTWLDLAQLSTGAQEQLALLSRLACARLLGREGGVVFFDDALGNTDRQRLERLGTVLRLASEHTQLIVLTCDSERFRHVGGAKRIVL